MKWINYNHLFYFWVVASEGGVIRASEELRLTQPTISNQIKSLEETLGHKLFERSGRGLKLTDAGQLAFSYANGMFSLAQELQNGLENRPSEMSIRLTVGVVDVIPKTIAQRLLAPAGKLQERVRLICKEDKADKLLTDLAARRLDLVLSDAPIGTAVQLEGVNHLLGESGISFFATKDLADKVRRGFPKSLNGTPMLLPSDHTQLRRSINLWLDKKRIYPIVAAEFDDTSMMLWFGREGAGVFPAPTIIEPVIKKEFEVKLVGRVPDIRERFYAITREKNPANLAVTAICRGGSIKVSDNTK